MSILMRDSKGYENGKYPRCHEFVSSFTDKDGRCITRLTHGFMYGELNEG